MRTTHEIAISRRASPERLAPPARRARSLPAPLFAPGRRAARSAKIKLGYVSPQTGPLAAFAEADNFIISNFMEAMKGGLEDRRQRPTPIEVVVKDSQSNPNRAAEVAKELIVDDKIDLMLVASTPETTNPVVHPVRDRGDAVHLDHGAVAALVHRPPGRSGRRPAGLEAVQLHLPLLLGARGRHRRVHQHVGPARRPTNRSAACFPTTATATPGATSRSASRRRSTSSGYKLIDPGRYQNLTDNFSAQITAFKNASCEIVTGVVLPPDFTTFWNQAQPAGLQAEGRVASARRSCSRSRSRRSAQAGNNLSSEVWWSPSHPFKSSLTGQSARELAAAYEQATGKQWTQPIGFVHALFEVAVDVLKRTPQIERPQGARRRDRRDQPRHRRRHGAVGRRRTCRPSPPRTSPRRRWSAASGA